MTDTSGHDEPSLLDRYDTEGHDPRTPNSERDDYMVRVPRSAIRDLESTSKEHRNAARQADDLKRENAMLKADIDLDSEKGRFFAKGYEGDLDADKIRETAQNLGVLDVDDTGASDSPPDEGDTPLEDGESDVEDERRKLEHSSPEDRLPERDPYKEAAELHSQLRDDGAQEKESLGGAFNRIVDAAHNGDSKVVIPGRSVQALGG